MIEISPSGLGLHFPKLDADLYVPVLSEGILGSRHWTAARLGKKGGSVRSAAKAEAARANVRGAGPGLPQPEATMPRGPPPPRNRLPGGIARVRPPACGSAEAVRKNVRFNEPFSHPANILPAAPELEVARGVLGTENRLCQ